MKNSLATFMKFIVITLVFTLTTFDLHARRGGGGGFSSRSSSRSYSSSRSSSSSRKSTGWGSSKKTSTRVSKPTASQTKKINAVKKNNADATKFKKMDTKSASYTKTDKELSKSIGKSGKTYKTRASAKADMTSKMASKKWDKQPDTRPSYIPPSYSSGGRTYNTTFVGGQYGYMNSMGTFVAYTATNMLVTDMMLHSYGYRPVHQTVPTYPAHVANNQAFGIFLTILLIIVIVVIILGGIFG